MPHVVIDFSQGIDETHDMQQLCETLHGELALDAEVSPTGLKIRARPQPYFHIGTTPSTFAHATLFLLEGRDDEAKMRLSDTILTVMDRFLKDVGSLTVDVRDMNRTTYAKRVKG